MHGPDAADKPVVLQYEPAGQIAETELPVGHTWANGQMIGVELVEPVGQMKPAEQGPLTTERPDVLQ